MMKILRCEHITEHLDDYLDGKLSKAEAAQYQRHLQKCQSCQALGKRIDQIREKYRFNVQAFS